jgi:hypothetical protein
VTPRNENREIRFSRHAELRLGQRSITKDEARQAIRSGAWAPNIGEGWITRAAFGGRVLDIVFVERQDDEGEVVIEVLFVVTVIDVGRTKR